MTPLLLRRRLAHAFAFLTSLLALVAVAPSVGAQTLSIVQSASLERLDAQGTAVKKRPLNLNPEGVGLQDCRDDQRIRFPLQMVGFEVNASVEAWASVSGASCDQQTFRQGPTAVCWRIATGIPLRNINDVIVPVRDIMSGVRNATAPDNSEGICGQVDLTTVVVQFLYFKPGQPATPATKAQIEIRVDTVGPPPVTIRSVLPGNGRLFVEWVSDGASTDGGGGLGGSGSGGVVEQAEVRVFCAPAGGTAKAPPTTTTVCNEPDASDPDAAPEDAGCIEVATDGGTSTGGTCSSPVLSSAAGEPFVPDAEFDAKYRCGRIIGPTGASATATEAGGAPLQNGTTYAVAVARTDGFGNLGELSDLLCETPEETTDFWQSYRDANGQGGGCSTGGGEGSLPTGTLAAASVAAFALVAFARKRVRREGRS